MLNDLIKEQKKLSKKYTVGYFSKDKNFKNSLNDLLKAIGINYDLISLNDLDNDTIELYLSSLDEAIFDSEVPENLTNILKKLNINIRITNLQDLPSLSQSIQDRSKIILELKKEKNYAKEKDLKFIMQIISILENKDPYTKDHSARVANYSLEIAKQFFSEQYDELYNKDNSHNSEQYEKAKMEYIIPKLHLTILSAWAHDIGKNNIAKSLLDKDSKLSEEEYDIMKLHADFGANMIRKLLGNEEFATIVENHHERIDGYGYHKLKEFHDISKIIAICDAFDSMTTTRTYTTKTQSKDKTQLKTVEEAITDLQVSSHLHFDIDENRMSQQLDTRLTDIFVKILKKDLELIKNGKESEAKLLSVGITPEGFLKTGFWDDKTQEYLKNPDSIKSNFI